LRQFSFSHPEVEDAAVVVIDYKEDETELPWAYVVRRGAALTPEDIYRYSAE